MSTAGIRPPPMSNSPHNRDPPVTGMPHVAIEKKVVEAWRLPWGGSSLHRPAASSHIADQAVAALRGTVVTGGAPLQGLGVEK